MVVEDKHLASQAFRVKTNRGSEEQVLTFLNTRSGFAAVFNHLK